MRAEIQWDVVVIRGCAYMSSTSKLWCLRASGILFSCSGRISNGLYYGEILRKQQLYKHGLQQVVCGRLGCKCSQVHGPEISFCYLNLSGLLICCSRWQI